MAATYTRVEMPLDHPRLATFLSGDEWPFHGRHRLTPDDIAAMDFSSPEVASFWITDAGETVGLVRLLDLGDIGEGAPLFDLRIAGRHHGHGYGRHAVDWLVGHLFTTSPELHRIEANTRSDNAAMQHVLAAAGFTHEGTLRDAWRGGDQRGDERPWFDTLVYGILRREWTPSDDRAGVTASNEAVGEALGVQSADRRFSHERDRP